MGHPLLLFLLLITNVLLFTNGEEVERTDAVKEVYGGSKQQPFTKALKDLNGNPLLKDLVEWFKFVSADVNERRKKSDGSECTLRGQPWIDKSIEYMKNRIILPVPDKSCATRTEHDKHELNRAEKLLKRSAIALKKAGERVKNDDAISAYWKGNGAYAYSGIKYDVDDQKCQLDYATAIKNNETWYIIAAVTSLCVNHGGPRSRIVEHVAENFASPLPLYLGRKGDPDFKNASLSSYTTAYAESKGSAQISRFLRMQFEQNRALTSALQSNLLAIDQAQDALTKSNFAILILPLFMSFIPVALIADVSDVATFFYVLLTDVFSAVPFVIKGVELVITGSRTNKNAETWLVGEESGTQIAETWVASCRPLARFKYIGIAVICAGLGAIIFGILLEYFTRKWMSHRRDQGERPEPFGPALLRMDNYIPIGANYMPINENYDDRLAPNNSADLPSPPPAAGPVRGGVSKLFSGFVRQRRSAAATRANNQRVEPSSVGVTRQEGNIGHYQGTEYEDM